MNVPDQLEYTRSHEWIRQEENIATIGITDYAQHMLGEIVSVGLPENGDTLYAGESFGTVKSAEFVSVLCAPVGGEVVAEKVQGRLVVLTNDDAGYLF